MAKTLGEWKVLGAIGHGAQSCVFRAVRVKDERELQVFALKRLSRPGTPKARARFAREIDALKRISHRGVIQPVDHSAQDADVPFYVMPYEEGVRPLSELVWASGDGSPFRMKPLECLEFVALCADALAAAHDAGVIHRDLKPDNILVRPDMTPLIIDFGCCVLLDDEGVLTLTDEGIGARNFMAPECEAGIEGQSSSRSDIYSLGKILWCMMSGERPFAREKPGFTNKLLTASQNAGPFAGFIVEAMLNSVRADPAHRLATAREFAGLCRTFAERIRSQATHISYAAPRCIACRSTNVEVSNSSIEGPLKLDAFVFLGNKANNPWLTAKFCSDCGTVTMYDTRPSDAYANRLSTAT